jgi:hypothetical protein
MAAGDNSASPPASARNPRITLVTADGDFAPVDAALRDFVLRLVRQYADLWPAVVAAGVRAPTRPWPECWEEHPGLVARLRELKRNHDQIVKGATKGDPSIAVYNWFNHLRNEVAVTAHAISGNICRTAHVPEPGIARPKPERQAPVAPPLPGQDVPVRAPTGKPPQPDPWAPFMGTARPPVGPAKGRELAER